MNEPSSAGLATVDDAVVVQLRDCRLDRQHVHSLARLLPQDDVRLAALIDGLVDTGDERALTALVHALVAGRRRLAADRLPEVVPILRSLEDVAAAVLHAEGDVVDALLCTLREQKCGWERDACLLLLAGWICARRETGRTLPEELTARARQLARESGTSLAVTMSLAALARLTEDEALREVLRQHGGSWPDDVCESLIEHFCARPAADPVSLLPEHAERVIHEGGTLRRAVAKIGRNDPCPCGSGRKYKRCCYGKDQERLRRSSEVAGLTVEEVEAAPEPFLTEARIRTLRSHKLARLRIERVAPTLQDHVLRRMVDFHLAEELVAAWERIGWRPDLEGAWEHCLFELARQGRGESVEKLVALRGLAPDDEAIPLPARLALLEREPAEYLRLAERVAAKGLSDPGETEYIDLACALLEGRFPGLGILVARGAVLEAGPFDRMTLLDAIGLARDRLSLPPEDAVERLLHAVAFDLPEGIDEQRREQLIKARRDLELAAAEVSRLRVQLAETERRLQEQERIAAEARSQPAASAQAKPSGAAPHSEAAMAELRRRIQELKSALSERHAERNALRRELNEAMSAVEALRRRAAAAAPAPVEEADVAAEEAALLAEEPAVSQPARLPVFPPRFQDTLQSVPENVRRAALALIGRLAAGEPGAFVGMRRLNARRDLCRVRVGADHRLFLRLAPDRLEVVDLINRKDFERWLKNRC